MPPRGRGFPSALCKSPFSLPPTQPLFCNRKFHQVPPSTDFAFSSCKTPGKANRNRHTGCRPLSMRPPVHPPRHAARPVISITISKPALSNSRDATEQASAVTSSPLEKRPRIHGLPERLRELEGILAKDTGFKWTLEKESPASVPRDCVLTLMSPTGLIRPANGSRGPRLREQHLEPVCPGSKHSLPLTGLHDSREVV